MAILSFKTVNTMYKAEVLEHESKFIAIIKHVKKEQEVKKFIDELKKEHKDAKHICFAYTIYSENGKSKSEKIYEDGEPQGTAGMPILNTIKKNSLGNILIAVVRYMNGGLLGTSLLTRAYAQAAEKVVKASILIDESFFAIYETEITYAEVKKFEAFAKENNIKIIEMEYLEDVYLKIALFADEARKKNELLNEIMGRKILLKNIGSKFV